MAIADDFSVANDGSGNIRYVGDGSTTYTVLAFKNFLGALLDDEQASGDDLADITTETIYDRSTDEILTLNAPYNVDDMTIEHLYDGSITQNGGDDQYSGLYVVGVVASGTEPMIIQDNKVLAPYWGEGINPDAPENVIMKIMVKSRSNGANINNKKIRIMSREFGDKYAEFDVTLGLANATGAIFSSADLNNETVEATVEGWTSIVNTEGWQELDIDGTGSAGQEYYSQWDKGSQSLNDVYERTKWIQKRATYADENNVETGDDYIVDNLTITGIGAEFSARDNNQKVVEARFWLKGTGGANAPTGLMYAEIHLSDDATPGIPTGGAIATSEPLDTNRLTTSYQECIFRFTDNITLTAGEDYFVVIQHPDGTATNYVSADGDATTGDDGTYAHNTAGWTGVSGEQLRFEVKTSPIIHTMAGELFRGINVEVAYDGATGSFTEDETVVWGTRIVYDGLNGGFTEGMYVSFWNGATWVNAGKVVYDNGTTEMIVALEDITGGTLAEDYIIKDVDGPATNYADCTATIEDQDKAGGEGILLANDDNGATGEFYLQVLSGANPVEDVLMRGISSTETAEPTAVITPRTISPEFVGVSTGTNIIGTYGIGFDPADVGSSDKFFDLSDTQRVPPNNVIFTVGGLVSGEDRVLVGPRTGSVMNKALYTLNGNHQSAGMTTVTVNEAIQTETPPEGNTSNSRIRVELQTGVFRRVAYNSWTGSVFTTPSTDWDVYLADSGADVFTAYIDILAGSALETFTAVHATNRDILIRVRDGGTAGDNEPIKTYEGSAQFTGSAQTVTINRVSDA